MVDLDQGIEAWCTEHHVQAALPGLQELGAETARGLPMLEDSEVKACGKELKSLVQRRLKQAVQACRDAEAAEHEQKDREKKALQGRRKASVAQ